MSSGHRHALYLEHDSPLHRLPPEAKVGAQIAFVLAVVATPREAFWAFAVHGAVVLGCAVLGRIPLGFLVRRLAIETPFVLFAVFLPFFASGPRMEIGGVGLSVEGLWAGWNILAKATLGVAATVVMAATTPAAEIIRGLERLKLPKALTAVAGFMVRYAEVITAEVRRMRIARESRGYNPRWIWQARAVASSGATLFLRSFERGERVFLAMQARGFDGRMPAFASAAAAPSRWTTALAPPAIAAFATLAAWVLR